MANLGALIQRQCRGLIDLTWRNCTSSRREGVPDQIAATSEAESSMLVGVLRRSECASQPAAATALAVHAANSPAITGESGDESHTYTNSP